jgi:hypothetical protein
LTIVVASVFSRSGGSAGDRLASTNLDLAPARETLVRVCAMLTRLVLRR